MDQAEAHKNKIVSDLKERLEERYARGDFNEKSMCMTMVSKGAWPRGTGIQPRLLSEAVSGDRVYEINCRQAAKFLEALGEKPPPKDMRNER